MKFKKINIFMLVLFLGLTKVNAATITLDGDRTIDEGDTAIVEVKLDLEEGETVDKLEFSLNYDSNLIKISEGSAEYGYVQSLQDNKLYIYKITDSIKEGVIATLNINNIAPESGETNLELKDIKVNDALKEGTVSKTFTLKKPMTTTTAPKNTSAKITNFTVNNAKVKPAFSADIKDYKIHVNKDTIKQITIKPVFEQTGTTIDVSCTLGCTSDASVPNKLNLVMGKNQATFIFTSEDGKNTETYNFTIYRGETTDGSNLLSDLKVEELELNEDFNKNTLDYSLTVGYEIEKLNVIATPEDTNADVKIKGADKLQVGENVITITVTSAETEEKKIYNITVIRQEFKPKETSTTKVTPTIEKDADKKDNDLWLIIGLGAGSLLIIGLAAYFIFFKKPKNKKPNKPKIEEISVKEKEFEELDELPKRVDEASSKVNVDDALFDLMKTKELEITKEQELNL